METRTMRETEMRMETGTMRDDKSKMNNEPKKDNQPKKKRREGDGVTGVVAALIWRGDRFLICQRPQGKARGLLWEFVGGKVEPGETGEAALVRECREELDITVSVRDVFMEVTHAYPDLTVHLTLYNASITAGEPKLLEHADLRWITPEEMDSFAFCPADREILERIRQTYEH